MPAFDYWLNVRLFHIFVVGIVLIYTGYYAPDVNPQWYAGVLGLGVLAVLYHGARLIQSFFPPKPKTQAQ